ncbi:MAG: DUF4383 domain-containing protein [bacterium]|nr:DUF4383 domain-containing protein [bacterium]
MAKKLALVSAIAFILFGVLGFIPNPLISSATETTLFETDALHNVVHLLFGIALLIASSRTNDTARKTLIGSGILYLVLTLAGFIQVGVSGEGMLLGLVHFNAADNWLHLVLTIGLITAGVVSKVEDITAHPQTL